MSRGPAVSLEYDTNTRQLLRELDRFKRQFPFATSKALNATADASRDKLRTTLPRYFTVRQGRRLKTGIRTSWSTKTKLAAWVGTVDVFMAEHIMGATREGLARRRTLPTPEVPAKTSRGKSPPGYKPKQLLAPKSKGSRGIRGFLVEEPGGEALLFQVRPGTRRKGRKRKAQRIRTKLRDKRKGRKRKARPKNPNIDLLFSFKPEQDIDRRWPFRNIVVRESQKRFGRFMQKHLGKAILSSKRP